MGVLNNELAMSYSHMANATLPLAQIGFTSEFGKGSGGSQVLWSPAQLVDAFMVLSGCHVYIMSVALEVNASSQVVYSSVN